MTLQLQDLLGERRAAGEAYFEREADRTARLCHRLAERFARGGRLIALGAGAAARSDARHVAVEFVHPVIVGKRALPALAVTETLERSLTLLARPDDIVFAFEPGRGEVAAALAAAAERGCLTVGWGFDGEWGFPAASEDPLVDQEIVETHYHVLWELVHVFFDHRGLLEGRSPRRVHDSGASSFLYPFLGEQQDDLDAVLSDVRASVLLKAEEIADLREQTLRDGHAELVAAAATVRASLEQGGTVLALGNGGSATDAMDLVADLREPPPALAARGWSPRAAIDLSDDTPIITAVANDIGSEAIFARQVIAYGRPGDVLVALSTSGNSLSVLAALRQARRDGLRTVAFVGYDGGRVVAEQLADHVLITRSEHIPRIQEAQASAYHGLRELIEIGPHVRSVSNDVPHFQSTGGRN
ncbi:MAG TPA: SIS domain-containing protein [Solirubrobacteraceae bacterium]|nr:SIS domain-containing protein [Solirubrobacteraceae bacterium]